MGAGTKCALLAARGDQRQPHRVRVSLLLLVFASACAEEATATEAPPLPPVHVEVAATTEITPTATGVATIEAAHAATLRSEAPGRVLELRVASGQRVEANEVIARLDVGRTAVALQAANAGVAQAEARLAQAQRQRELAARLVQSGGAAQRQLDDAVDGVRLAQAGLEAARAQTRVTRRGITEASLRAPFAGTIAETFVEEGELASPGAPVAHLVDTSGLEARVLLDPRQALDVPVGARVRVEASARPDEVFEGEVLRVGEVVDARTRRLPVEVAIQDPEHRLRPGLVARITVETGDPRTALLVRGNAIFERYEQSHVFVVGEGDVAERRVIEVGTAHENQLEVRAGLEPGERIVVDGLDRVVHDRPVRIVDPLAQTSDE